MVPTPELATGGLEQGLRILKNNRLQVGPSTVLVGIALAVAVASCGETEDGISADAAESVDATSTPFADAAIVDAGDDGDARTPPVTCEPSAELGRGFTWVRENPMFISGIVPGGTVPDSAGAADYFDVFGANAAHLWENGLPTLMDAWAALETPGFQWVSWLKFDGTSHDGGEVIGGYAANPPGRIGYQIGDEPRTWADYNNMVAGLAAVKAADPDGLRYINFSHYADNIDAFLTDYGTKQLGDVISYDVYDTGKKAHGRMGIFRKASVQYGIPNWCYIKYFTNGSAAYWSDADMRWSVFLHALNGCTGFTWFVYQIGAGHELVPAGFSEQGNYASAKTIAYTQAATINSELANLGRTLTQLTSTDVRYNASLPLAGPGGVTAWAKGAGGDPYLDAASASGTLQDLSLGFFQDDACETYVMVQNPNHPKGALPTDNSDSTTVTLDFDFSQSTDTSLDTTKVDYLDKVTGIVASYDLTDLGGGHAQLTVQLQAGEIFFFKYRTANPFVQQAL